MTLQKFSQSIIENNAMLCVNRDKAARVVEIAICLLPISPDDTNSYKRRIRAIYGQMYGFKPFMFILGIVINLAVKLILEWWFSAIDIDTLRNMKAECQPQLQSLNPY